MLTGEWWSRRDNRSNLTGATPNASPARQESGGSGLLQDFLHSAAVQRFMLQQLQGERF